MRKLLNNKIVIGHSLENDFEVLNINFDKLIIRDIADFCVFKGGKGWRPLKELSKEFLDLDIQNGFHCSVEDSRASLELYKLYKKEIDWDQRDKTKLKESFK